MYREAFIGNQERQEKANKPDMKTPTTLFEEEARQCRSNREICAVGIGEVLFDCLPDGKRLGGAPANFAYHAAQLGLRAGVVSAIGDDALGRLATRLLWDKGLTPLLATVPYPTGKVKVEISDQGIPSYDILPNMAYDNIPYTPQTERIAKRCMCACFGSLAQRGSVSQHTIRRFLDAMPNGSLQVFDANLRQNWYTREVLFDSLLVCNVLKLSDEELAVVNKLMRHDLDSAPEHYESDSQRVSRYRETCQSLAKEFYIPIIIVTCGSRGSYVYTAAGEESFLPSPEVCVADTVGAGDAFTATFCTALVARESIAEAHRKAVEVSAYVCTQHGAMPTLPPALRKNCGHEFGV